MKKRGVALIWSLVISAVLMILATTMANTILKESSLSVRIESSTAAFAAANTGVEWAKFCYEKGRTPAECSVADAVIEENNSRYTVVTSKESGKTVIRSTGTSNNVTRKIEYTMENSDYAPVSFNGSSFPTLTTTANKSFSLKLELWHETAATGSYRVGLTNNEALKKRLYLKYDSVEKNFYLMYQNDGLALDSSNPVKSEAIGPIEAYPEDPQSSIIATIDYLEDTGARLTIQKKLANGNKVDCLGAVTISMVDKALVPSVTPPAPLPTMNIKVDDESSTPTLSVNTDYGSLPVFELLTTGAKVYFSSTFSIKGLTL